MQPTYIKDDFFFFREIKTVGSILGDRLIFDPNRVNEIIDYVNENNIKSITINPSFFKVDTLDFLKYTPLIEGIYILQNNLDISILNTLSKLRVLGIGSINQILDFANFPDLEVLSVIYSKYSKNINLCNKLFWLWIEGYKKENLIEFKNLTNLQYLNLHRSLIKNLEGIEGMKVLKKIYLDDMRKLESLKGLNEQNNKLEILDIWSAKNLTNYDDISKINSLKQLELRKTGETKSISFIKGLPNLKKVTLGFKVLDGNMGYLTGIEKVGFIDFKHYTHQMKDFSQSD